MAKASVSAQRRTKNQEVSNSLSHSHLQHRSFAPLPTSRSQMLGQLSNVGDRELSTYNFAQLPLGSSVAPVQAKLTIGKPNDPYEQEADRVAHQVVQQIHSPQFQREAEEPVQRLFDSSVRPIMRRADAGIISGEASAGFEQALNGARAGGAPLDPALRPKLEASMGADFSGVKVHTDVQADQLSQSIQARAFTTGQDVFFKQGEYNPSSRHGQELLAHELTHVVQQGGGTIRTAPLQKKGDDGPVKAGFIGEEADDPVGNVDLDGFGETAKKQTLGTLGKGSELLEDPSSSQKTTTEAGKVTTTETSSKGFAGAGAVIQKLTETDELTLKQAFQALACAGAFGETSAKKAVETSSGSSASASGTASGFAGAKGEAVSVAVQDAINGITLLAKVSAEAGVGFELSGVLEAATQVGGVELSAKLASKLSGFAGVMAEAKGKFEYSATQLALAGKAYAMAGAKSEGEAMVTLSAGELGLEGGGKYEAFAGAEAGVEGKIAIGVNSIAVSGKAEAFAGAKVKASASAAMKYQGKILIKVSGELEASAGVGGSLEGSFSYENGKLIVSGKLAATLGLGGGAGFAVEVDFKEIGHVILEKIRAAITAKAIDRNSIADEDRDTAKSLSPEEAAEVNRQLYDAVYPYFKAYGDKKAKLVRETSIFGNRKADNLIKREMIQEIIDNKILKKPDLAEKVKYKMSDIVLEQAAMDAFGDQLKSNELIIQAGIIRAFGVKRLEDYLGSV